MRPARHILCGPGLEILSEFMSHLVSLDQDSPSYDPPATSNPRSPFQNYKAKELRSVSLSEPPEFIQIRRRAL